MLPRCVIGNKATVVPRVRPQAIESTIRGRFTEPRGVSRRYPARRMDINRAVNRQIFLSWAINQLVKYYQQQTTYSPSARRALLTRIQADPGSCDWPARAEMISSRMGTTSEASKVEFMEIIRPQAVPESSETWVLDDLMGK